MNFDVRIAFIIFQAHVELGLMLLDQRHLQQERLQFRLRGDHLDVGYLPPQTLRFYGIDVGAEI